jgi:hypothetical protein
MLAHDGLFWMLNVSVPPPGLVTVGVKLYVEPAFTALEGVPEIVRVPADTTLIANAGSELVCTPSVTLMTTFEYVPTWLLEGVPESIPVDVLKPAHDGMFSTENVRAVPLAALVVGLNA